MSSNEDSRSPWNRRGPVTMTDIDEALQPRKPWADLLESTTAPRPTAADFRAAGLSEVDADRAVEGLTEGRFLSFEDACLSVALFGPPRVVTLDESAMRELARHFAGVKP